MIAVRRLTLADLGEIERIERHAYPTPWSRSMFAGELAKPSSVCVGAYDDLQAASLAGYLIVSRYVDAWHIMNIAVDEPHRRRGIAKRLLDELFSAPATRRAAEYLRGRLRSPAGELPAGDEPLARLVAELVIRAGELEATPAKLELEALQLDLHNLDRRIATARTEGHERIRDLAAERQQVLDAIRHRLS